MSQQPAYVAVTLALTAVSVDAPVEAAPAPVAVRLRVNGEAARIQGLAMQSLAPGYTASVFWEVGATSQALGGKEGYLQPGEYAVTLHMRVPTEDFAYHLRTLTPEECRDAACLTLREGGAGREMSWSTSRVNTGAFVVERGKVSCAFEAELAGDPLSGENDGSPRTLELQVSGLPRPVRP